MADLQLKRSENQPGAYFVDASCISCEACWKEAPKNFASHRIYTYAFVLHQPRTMLEKGQCRRALEICPVNAIGTDTPIKPLISTA